MGAALILFDNIFLIFFFGVLLCLKAVDGHTDKVIINKVLFGANKSL